MEIYMIFLCLFIFHMYMYVYIYRYRYDVHQNILNLHRNNLSIHTTICVADSHRLALGKFFRRQITTIESANVEGVCVSVRLATKHVGIIFVELSSTLIICFLRCTSEI